MGNIDKSIKLLSHESPRKRFLGISNIAELASALPLQERKSVIGELGKLVSDPEAFVRWNLAEAFGKIGHPASIPYLEKLGRFDEHANVRLRVMYALGLIGHKDGVPILESTLQDHYQIVAGAYVVRQFAALALGMIHSEESVKALEKFVEDSDPIVRWHTAVALGNIGLKSGIPHLGKLVDDPIPFTRAHTAIALAQIGDKSGRPYVERLTKDNVDKVARISKDALKLLGGINS